MGVLDMRGCEERTRRAAAARETSRRPGDDAPARKCVSIWQAYNHRRWQFECDLLGMDERAPFVCECTSDDCVRAVELTSLEFEAAHLRPEWTAVIPGHLVTGDGSHVVGKHPHFWIVELTPVFDRDGV